ncbi:hypothetical protein EDC96DRAFT_445089 [Choanephora cucurbitarum]|nr:hypothetical protein EDC96DRAFT_445089 [Choanephora cucurbitarum]
MDSLPEVNSAPLLSSVSPSSSAPSAWFTAFQAKFKQYEERCSQLGSVVAPAPTPGEAYGKSNKLVSFSAAAAQAKPKVKITYRHCKAAARIFVVSAPPVGSPVDGPLFEYVYLPNKYRAHLSVFRQKLRLIGLDNSRVLDVHYSALDVIALLIHTAYKEGLLKVMNKYSLPILTDFNPFSGALNAKSRELQQARLIRALGYIREQNRRLVAYDFVCQG